VHRCILAQKLLHKDYNCAHSSSFHVTCSINPPVVQLKLQYRRMLQSHHVIKHVGCIHPQITFDLYRPAWIGMTFRICGQTCARAFIRRLPLEFSSETTHYACRANKFVHLPQFNDNSTTPYHYNVCNCADLTHQTTNWPNIRFPLESQIPSASSVAVIALILL